MYYYARTGNVNAVQSTKETLPGDPGPAVNLGRWLDRPPVPHARAVGPAGPGRARHALASRWTQPGTGLGPAPGRGSGRGQGAGRGTPPGRRRPGARAAAALGEILYGIQHGAADRADRHLARGLRAAVYYYARTGNVNAVQSTKETLPGDPGPAVNLGRWLTGLRYHTRVRWVRPVLDALGMRWPAAEPSREQDWARLLDEAPVAGRALAAAPRRDGAGPGDGGAAALGEILAGIQHGAACPPTPNLARSLRAAVDLLRPHRTVNAPQYIQVTLPGDPGPGEPGRLAVRSPERTDAPAAGSAGAGDAEHAYPGVGDHEIEQ